MTTLKEIISEKKPLFSSSEYETQPVDLPYVSLAGNSTVRMAIHTDVSSSLLRFFQENPQYSELQIRVRAKSNGFSDTTPLKPTDALWELVSINPRYIAHRMGRWQRSALTTWEFGVYRTTTFEDEMLSNVSDSLSRPYSIDEDIGDHGADGLTFKDISVRELVEQYQFDKPALEPLIAGFTRLLFIGNEQLVQRLKTELPDYLFNQDGNFTALILQVLQGYNSRIRKGNATNLTDPYGNSMGPSNFNIPKKNINFKLNKVYYNIKL